MTTTLTRIHRSADLLRGLGAAVALVLFVFGAPIALIALAPIYLPDAAPTLSELGHALTSPDDGSLLFALLAVIGWVTWAGFTVSVVIEVIAGARRMTAPSIPLLGSAQRAASGLLTTAALLVTLTTTSAGASPAAASSFTVAPARWTGDDSSMTGSSQPAMTPRAPSELPRSDDAAMTDRTTPPPMTAIQPAPSVTVQRGDTLWDLAERHLGAGTRFAEIRDLNLGRPQADGRTLQDADWIYPGWILLLPADATGTHAPDAPVTLEQPSTVIVQPGDSLWSIAAQHLGDGERFTELADMNAGQPQPDGTTMTDPNLIQPGWHITLPAYEPSVTVAALGSPAVSSLVPAEPGMPVPAGEPTSAMLALPGPDREAPHMPVSQKSEPRPTGAHAERSPDVALYFAGFTALAAAGVIGEITRRRHLQRRARRVGESIPLPEPGSPEASTERALRSAPTPVTIPAIQTALANLGCRCYQAERDLPRIGALTLDEHTLTLHLLDDDADPVTPFTSGGPRTWHATTTDIAGEEPIDDDDRCVPYPALVTLGHTDNATLILNLEAAGTLAILGNHEQAEAALRAIIVELATSDLSGQLCIEADEPLTHLAEAFDFVRLHTTDKPGPARSRHTEQVADVLTDSGIDDTLQARSDRILEDTWLPVIYVEHEPTDPTPATPWSATILITRAPVDGAWTLELDDQGAARLSPFGIDLRPQRLTLDQLEVTRSLLLTSLPPSLDAAHHHKQADVDADIAAMAAAQQPNTAPTDDDSEPTLHINVLGPIQITGLTNPRAPLSPRMQELLVYLALRGPATGPALDEVLWDGARVAPTTRNALIYRTRGRVGEDVLPRLEGESTFALGPRASTDWHQFQQCLSQALNGPETKRIDALSEALSLVRDRPFLGIGGTQYTWADHDIQQMISSIADAAHVLAQLQLDAGHPRDALHAATLGLLVEPYSEQLQNDAIHATEASAGPQEARRLRERFTEQLLRLDPELSA